jgi:hypothetical protein
VINKEIFVKKDYFLFYVLYCNLKFVVHSYLIADLKAPDEKQESSAEFCKAGHYT